MRRKRKEAESRTYSETVDKMAIKSFPSGMDGHWNSREQGLSNKLKGFQLSSRETPPLSFFLLTIFL